MMNKRGVNENKREYMSPFYNSDKLLQWCGRAHSDTVIGIEWKWFVCQAENWLGFSGKYQILWLWPIRMHRNCIYWVYKHTKTHSWSPYNHWLDNKFTKYYLLNDFFSPFELQITPQKRLFKWYVRASKHKSNAEHFNYCQCVCIYT